MVKHTVEEQKPGRRNPRLLAPRALKLYMLVNMSKTRRVVSVHMNGEMVAGMRVSGVKVVLKVRVASSSVVIVCLRAHGKIAGWRGRELIPGWMVDDTLVITRKVRRMGMESLPGQMVDLYMQVTGRTGDHAAANAFQQMATRLLRTESGQMAYRCQVQDHKGDIHPQPKHRALHSQRPKYLKDHVGAPPMDQE